MEANSVAATIGIRGARVADGHAAYRRTSRIGRVTVVAAVAAHAARRSKWEAIATTSGSRARAASSSAPGPATGEREQTQDDCEKSE